MGKKAAFTLQESPLRADEWWAASSKPAAPHHFGHRERLRHRAAHGLGALPDYELLELFLFRSLPQGDVKTMNFDSATGSKPKAWRDIWGSGQGIGAVKAVTPVAEFVARLGREYDAAKARVR